MIAPNLDALSEGGRAMRRIGSLWAKALIATAAMAMAAIDAPPAAAEPAVALQSCETEVVRPFYRDAHGRLYRIGAASRGHYCESADALVAIFAPNGQPVWSARQPVSGIIGLAGAPTRDAMRRGLELWAFGADHLSRADDLPHWPSHADQPRGGGVRVALEPGWSRARWRGLRHSRDPIFCYSERREFLTCVRFEPDGPSVEPIGSLIIEP